jgi:hypothetical protein
MAKRRGRPSKASQKQILEHDGGKIAAHFLSYPLRQPVDPRFDPYYRRILNGDLFAVWDYYGTGALEGSFYELIGRLVPLQYFAAAKQIISDVQLCGDEFDTVRGGTAIPPDWVVYEHWCRLLHPLCKVARQFIRKNYEDNPWDEREDLWKKYCDHFFAVAAPILVWRVGRVVKKFQLGLKTLGDLKAWGETEYAKCGQNPHRHDPAMTALVEQFGLHHLVPRPVFFDLAAVYRHPELRPGYDKRRHYYQFSSTPSMIARKYACAMVGLSPSSVSHK